MYMRYCVVNDRQAKGTCAFCGAPLQDEPSYTHNLETDELFETPACAEADIYATAITRGALVSLPQVVMIIGECHEK